MTTGREDVERTPDGRWIVVDGRRWRATDPQIPDRLRAELVAALMSGRRAVRDHEPDARARVHDAKVALGERGRPWWEQSNWSERAERATSTIRALLRARAPHSSICPSDVARVIGGSSWRGLLDEVRAVAADLRRDGLVRITQGSEDVDPATARGPLRIRRGSRWPD